MKPGDLLEYRCPKFGIVWQWRVHSVLLGGLGQESLIEVAPVMATPGTDTNHKRQNTVFVPEPMTRTLHLIDVEALQAAAKETGDE